MFGTAILVFREVLEAALIIGLVGVATREVASRFRWITVGVFCGLAGAVAVALMADVINGAAAGLGQELLNALILFAAVIMLGWHNIWMKRHGAELAKNAKHIGMAVSEGLQPMYALTALVGLAVLREGAEVVLFLYSMFAAGTPLTQITTGSFVGLGVGTLFGAGLYFGLLRIPTRYLFRVTSIMLLMLSAGLAAQAAGFLVQADVISVFTNSLWDTSWLVSERSVVGSILHALIGYIANPMGIQLVFYIATIVVIGGMMWAVDRPNTFRTVKTVVVVLGIALFSTLFVLSPKVHASDHNPVIIDSSRN